MSIKAVIIIIILSVAVGFGSHILIMPEVTIPEPLVVRDTIKIEVIKEGETIYIPEYIYKYDTVTQIDTVYVYGDTYSSDIEMCSADSTAKVNATVYFNVEEERFYFTNILFTVEETTIIEQIVTTIQKKPCLITQFGTTFEESPVLHGSLGYIYKNIILSVGYTNTKNVICSIGLILK